MRTFFTSAVASSSKNPHVRSCPRQSLRLFTSTPVARDDRGSSRSGDQPTSPTPPRRGGSFGMKSSSTSYASSASRLSRTERSEQKPSKGGLSWGQEGAKSVEDISSDLEARHTESEEEGSRDFQNLFKMLRQKPAESSEAPRSSPSGLPGARLSMAARLQLDTQGSTSLGRTSSSSSKARFNRAGGVTPHEATAFNKVIADVLSTFPKSDRPSKPYAGPAAPYQPSAYDMLGGRKVAPTLNNVGRERVANLRGIFGKNKDDEATMEEFDLLSEEMDVIGNDTELLHWAKERVFTPVRGGEKELAGTSITVPVFPATINTPSSTSAGGPPPMLEYRLAYSKILARVLRTFRVHYNQPHLVLALFEHARTISVESYMQGCSTEVFNEMLITRWECFRDLEGIFAATNEMDVMGVPWDQHTMQIVNAAVTTVSQEGMQPGNTRWSERELVISAQLDKQVEKDVVTEERFTAFARKQKDRLRYEMGASVLPAVPEEDDQDGFPIDPLAALGRAGDKWSGTGPAGGSDRLD